MKQVVPAPSSVKVRGGCGWGWHPVLGHWSRWWGGWVPPHCASYYGWRARGEPMSSDFLRKAIGASGLRQYIYQLRRALAGSRYRVERHHYLAYELKIDED